MNITPWNRYWEDGTGNGEALTSTRGMISLVPVPEDDISGTGTSGMISLVPVPEEFY
jgi:hypothetical protein